MCVSNIQHSGKQPILAPLMRAAFISLWVNVVKDIGAWLELYLKIMLLIALQYSCSVL